MEDKVMRILTDVWHHQITRTEAKDKILSLKAESEIVVSDSPDVKHGALHGVRKLECEAAQSDLVENTNDAALEIRIDSENPKQKLVNLQTYKDDKRDKEIIEKVIRNTKSF